MAAHPSVGAFHAHFKSGTAGAPPLYNHHRSPPPPSHAYPHILHSPHIDIFTMNNIPSSSQPSVPSIHIQAADGASALFDSGDIFSMDIWNSYNPVPDDSDLYTCRQSEYFHSSSFTNSSSDLEDISELSHLATPYLTSHGYSLPYSTILQENGTSPSVDGGLSPSSLGSAPSPASSFTGSLSPSSLYDPIMLSDSESLLSPSPSPATPDQQFHWPPQVLNHQSTESLVVHPSFIGSFSNDSILPPTSLGPPAHRRSKSSPSRQGPVASKAMLEANSRRRRHPAQFQCTECEQTFTALFSLKRHMQSHSGEKPFACSISGCTQRFFNSSDCKRHEKSKKRHKEVQ